MKSIIRQAIFLLPVSLLAVTFMVHADCSATGSDCLNSPTSKLSTIPAFIAAFLLAIAKIGLPIISVYFVIVGYMFVAAQGRPEPLNVAKRNLMYSFIGATMILSAWALSNLIAGTVTQVVG